jgi:hypothetical protein
MTLSVFMLSPGGRAFPLFTQLWGEISKTFFIYGDNYSIAPQSSPDEQAIMKENLKSLVRRI